MTQETQLGFYFDSSKCTGCKTCHIACKDRMVGKTRSQDDVVRAGVSALPGMLWRRVYEYGGGSWAQNGDNSYEQDVFAYYASIGCNHCSEPVCVKACPTGAMHKRKEDGLVLVQESLCIGCESCSRACPYDAPQIDVERKVMTKCDGCLDRLKEGKKPICVEGCPLRALDFDTMENLRAKYGEGDGHFAPLPSPSITSPNLIVKAAKKAQPSGAGNGRILNIREV
ncbi:MULTISPECIES: DMSO/selenate family reductase complex B subunit [Shewanella]|uniref:Dimethylsulfoxide reductase subunit B n=1 Tax=Shewanella insulae TaxID=2681496 RepID=A0A6L7HZB7_9GAMM|nr:MULTISPECIES: DMSO/selenate family reductase complex B subunit [Shewanella]MCG9745962.1 dimethylsulfoxide reductase subunit B [Shewanella sp. Isolate8]MXR69350.1 dimethylsulfoxide reductase subunit B [Shewanella insulae]